MKSLLLLTTIFISLLGCTKKNDDTCIDERKKSQEIFCDTHYEPVCGCNNVTYSNACVATNQGGVKSYTYGVCAGDISLCIDSTLICNECFCTYEYAPVCGCDGKTYSNACEAEKIYGVTSYTQNACN